MKSRFISIHTSNKRNETFIYSAAAFFLWIKMCALYIWVFHINIQSIGQGVVLATTSLGSAAFFLGIGFLFRKSARLKAFFVIDILLTGILFGNVLYYRFYIDFITVPVLLQFQNVGGLSQSTVELIKFYDIWMFLDLFLLVFFMRKKYSLSVNIPILKNLKKRHFLILTIVPLLFSMMLNSNFWNKSYDKELIVKSLGLYYYHIFDIFQYSKTSVNSVLADESEVAEITHYLEKKHKKKVQSNFHGIAKGKNVIVIFLESTQGFVIDKKVNNQEVTPFLNKLKNESLYFPNFYHQTAQGKTSDAEFIVDNSLYPLAGGSVFVRKPKNEFMATPEILKKYNYYSASFHGNDSQFWNRLTMYDSLGYDRFFSKEDYDVNEENSINYGLKDIPFFEQSMPYLSSLPQPFYAKFLTLTNHFPFLLNPEDQFIPELETDQGVVNRYFTTVRYEDEAIKSFFEQIKDTELYNNSIFVLFGDHYGISKSYNDALSEVLGHEITVKDQVELQKVPLFIHIPGMEGKVVNTVGGQIDLRATIFDLLGVDGKDQAFSFGTSLLSKEEDRLVVFRDGTFTTDRYIYAEGTCYSKDTGSKVKRNKCSPYFNQVQNELNYSDKIIYGDLFRFFKK
ncbi:LTA synthase family protein [Lederbergia wuyishanensis]|uniref:Phosphoglycerol transferase MdoB-like AlkP superfamily enzyme n=1 Tax=Lederbergia wuyishanensis TaxID=1347903 RepID=A0ABU0D228_9BACI|nr:LTA synthase family protein [Lederbergia wuyishanensis]MCJ8007388.1 LTA synthase family protein [Lederbergia wuyishanensis]MDQ0342445.1 phosphoglycerol transferase MdoB-like AlkP superfamily enzyme [Lederbergia wuyishanensis]